MGAGPDRMEMARRTRLQLASSMRAATPGGCTRETQRCPDARDYRKELRPCCRSHLVEIVRQTLPVLQGLGVVVWADYGTLLGAVRNPLTTWKDYPWLPQEGRDNTPLSPGIIPHDKDADFSMVGVDFFTLCRARSQLERMGFRVLVRPQGRSMKVRLSPSNGTNADFFLWREHPGGILRRVKYIAVDNYKGRDFHKESVFPLSTVDWEGLNLPAPKDPAAFCAFRYGPNWRTPVPANHDGVRR